MAILWIVAISFGMLACVEHLGEILEINHFTMGLVIIAVGTSIPDAISSVIVAKEGFGNPLEMTLLYVLSGIFSLFGSKRADESEIPSVLIAIAACDAVLYFRLLSPCLEIKTLPVTLLRGLNITR